MCKHVHLVCMYEERKGTNSVLDEAAEVLGQNSQIRIHHQEEISQFLKEKMTQEEVDEVTEPNWRIVTEKHLTNWIHNLNDETFVSFWKDIQGIMRKADEKSNTTTTKRKMEKQEYFPTKKRKKA